MPVGAPADLADVIDVHSLRDAAVAFEVEGHKVAVTEAGLTE